MSISNNYNRVGPTSTSFPAVILVSIGMLLSAYHNPHLALYFDSAGLVMTTFLVTMLFLHLFRQIMLWGKASLISLIPTVLAILASAMLMATPMAYPQNVLLWVRFLMVSSAMILTTKVIHFIIYPNARVLNLYIGRSVVLAMAKKSKRYANLDKELAKAKKSNNDNNQESASGITFRAEPSKINFQNIIGMVDLKAKLKKAAELYAKDDKNGILLHGSPGSGKTLMAQAFAGEMGLPIISVSVADLASKWINETTQNVGQLFRDAIAQQPCVLFVDEVDSIISERSKGGGYEERANVVNAFLTGSVDIRKQEVFLIAATNLLSHLDSAAIREGRFDFKIEVPLPDKAARLGLIKKILNKYGATVAPKVLDSLVRRWKGFNVPRILEVTTRACRDAGLMENTESDNAMTQLGLSQFYHALRAVQGHKSGVPENAKKLADLFLDTSERERLESIVLQIKEIDRVEEMGGSIPRGLVFYGPPGTGKTTVATALAAETGWSFISRSGSDMFKAGAVDELRDEASELRPCIVFLDEADDILANRSYSGYKSVTNGLLTLVDGADGNLPDVVWVAATNDISSMDVAALRGGRFEQKIKFAPPSGETLMAMLVDWADRNQALVDAPQARWVQRVAIIVTGMTLADLGSTLASARNIAIARALQNGQASPIIQVDDVRVAASEVKSPV